MDTETGSAVQEMAIITHRDDPSQDPCLQVTRGSAGQMRGSADQVRGSTDRLRGSADQVRGSTNRLRGSTGQLRGSADQVRGAISQKKGNTVQMSGTRPWMRGIADRLRETTGRIRGHLVQGPMAIVHRGLVPTVRNVDVIYYACGIFCKQCLLKKDMSSDVRDSAGFGLVLCCL